MSNEPALLTAGDSDADDLPRDLEPGGQGRRRGMIVSVALLSSLIGVIVFLVVVFQPFADGAGGCGGG